MAFTTIGYGDYYPATPAGRSVFVVWAILGVGTMTVLISGALICPITLYNSSVHYLRTSVVQEAYGSRYKNAMHIRAFDKAVKRYREWIHNTKAVAQRKGRRWNNQGHTTAEAEPSQGQARSTSSSSAGKRRADVGESHARAQETLESLPNHVLHHAKTFHTYIRLFVDDANVLDSRRGGAKAGTDDEVSVTLRRLLDKIARLGGIGKGTKDEILQDPDARHVSNASPFYLPTYNVPFLTDPVHTRH